MITRHPWASIRPTVTACTTWQAMCMNGVLMSTKRISILVLRLRTRSPMRTLWMGLLVISEVLKQIAYCAAGRGIVFRGTCGSLVAFGLPLRTRPLTADFVV